jgi:membrane-bound lytic murein transglycosylase F
VPPSKKTLAKHRKINLRLALLFTCLVALAAYLGHRESVKQKQFFGDLPEIQARGELRALTLYSSTSYFIYRDREMGYEYELCERLANSLGLKLRMVVVPNILALMDSLEAGAGDIIAYNVPLNHRIKSDYLPCGREFLTHQVLVQRRDNPNLVRDVTDLIGKEVVVQRGTRYHTRLNHLNEELGGGLNIKVLDEDSITTEDLIGQVAAARINYTVVDNVQAQFNKTYFKNLHITTRISFPQHSFWLVRKESPMLAAAVNAWFVANVSSDDYKAINKRYFERSKGPSPFLTTGRFIARDGSLSPYDALFKRLGGEHGLDWRLLASIAYQESKFDAQVVSWAGAVGLMQLMPRTAEDYGVDADSLTYPEHNVLAAVRLLNSLKRPFKQVPKGEDRHKLALAAFNSGLGHVIDARALARKYGKNPDSWTDVCEFLLLKRLPAYYEDPVCKQGYLRGNETADFVTEVWTRYQYYLEKGVK